MQRLLRLLHTALFLAGVVTLVTLLAPDPAQAQSSVRPPGQAMPLQEDGGPSNALGEASDADIWRQIRGAQDESGTMPSATPGRRTRSPPAPTARFATIAVRANPPTA